MCCGSAAVGQQGSGRAEFSSPHSVAVDHLGRVWVADRGNNRTQVFSEKFEWLGEWTCMRPGTPWGVRLSPDVRVDPTFSPLVLSRL